MPVMTQPTFNPMGRETPSADLEALGALWRHGFRTGKALEVGTWAGRTALVLLDHFDRVWCVDNWACSPWEDNGRLSGDWPPRKAFQGFCRNMGPHLMRDVFPCVGDSLMWAAAWPRNVPLDLVFLDGDHRYASVAADIRAWLPHVAPGGVLAGHDHGIFDGVTQAVDTILPHRQISGLSLWHVTIPDPNPEATHA